MTPFHAILPLSVVHGPILVTQLANSVAHSIDPGALVFDAFFWVVVNSSAVAKSVQNLTFVGASVCPVVASLSGDLIILEFAFVCGAVSPLKGAFSVKKAVVEFTFVFVAVFEDAGALAVVDFADLRESSGG